MSNSGPPPGMPSFPIGAAPGQPYGFPGGAPPGLRIPPGMQPQPGTANQTNMQYFAGAGGFGRPGAAPAGQSNQPLAQSMPAQAGAPNAQGQLHQLAQPAVDRVSASQPQQQVPQQFQQSSSSAGSHTVTTQLPSPSVLSSATISLIEHLDKRIFIVLRDGRKFSGILRSFDQFANIVLEQTVERIFIGNKYGEKSLGIFLIRGENVVILGEDVEKERQLRESGKWEKVEFAVIEKLDKQEKEAKIEQAKLKRKLLLSRGLTSVASSSGYSLFGFDPFHAQLFDDGGGI